jgi:NAD(P)-dependent dehydrogenase (short-subunit alcohol dehydrogenase family)
MQSFNQFKLSEAKNILIVGAGHGIGLALVEYFKDKDVNVFATYRLEHKAKDLLELSQTYPHIKSIQLDPTIESEIETEIENIPSSSLDLVINCVGLLHTESITPEKSLRDFNPESFMEIMRVNALVTPLLAKHCHKLFNPNKACAFVSLSAKLGSISDNQMGGWYSYRASKAALNMLIKNIAIEFKRLRKKVIVLAIHPGTTKTALSEKYIQHTNYKIHTPQETALNILSVIDNQASENFEAKFLSWDGTELSW